MCVRQISKLTRTKTIKIKYNVLDLLLTRALFFFFIRGFFLTGNKIKKLIESHTCWRLNEFLKLDVEQIFNKKKAMCFSAKSLSATNVFLCAKATYLKYKFSIGVFTWWKETYLYNNFNFQRLKLYLMTTNLNFFCT